ncbi:MAG: mobile mystery protein B [Actinomycetota bacterium]|nr:mobile mystery protein B [Actinomycetota bacterium]MDQ2957005.1 mobile mystery protein B [Actinomycetota bacterium]
MTPFGDQPDGATPLTTEDVQGLKPSWITTQGELNQAEAENILRGRLWASRTRRPSFWYLRDTGLQNLHRRLLGDVWSWAGALRKRETNIGIDPHQVPVALRSLCDDIEAQIGDGRNLAYPADELAIRFHHRLVLIHPFANGNGRHARLATDLLLIDLHVEPFTWGGAELTNPTNLRADYLTALRRADSTSDFTALLEFARRTG